MARRTVPIMQCDKLCYSDNITSIQLRKVLSNWAENANLAILQSAGQGRLLPNIQMGEKLFSKCQFSKLDSWPGTVQLLRIILIDL